MWYTVEEFLKPLNIHILLHLQNFLEYFELLETQSANLWTRHYPLNNFSSKSKWISRTVSIRDEHDKSFKYLIKGQFRLMQTGIKQVDNRFNWIHQCKLGIGVYGNNDIQYVSELWVSWNGLIFTNVYESFMDPVTYTFEGVGLMVAFKNLGLEHFKYSLRKISKVMVNVLIGHLLEVESAIADSKNMLNVCHRNLQVCPAHLQNFLPETQQV